MKDSLEFRASGPGFVKQLVSIFFCTLLLVVCLTNTRSSAAEVKDRAEARVVALLAQIDEQLASHGGP